MASNDETFMGMAQEEAYKGAALGNTWVGAVIVKDGAVIGRGHNTVISDRQPLNHAETMAIVDACRRLGRPHLGGATLYCTMEPCPLCLWGIVRAGIDRVVLGGRYASMGRNDMGSYSVEALLAMTGRSLELVTGVRSEECERLRREHGWLPVAYDTPPDAP